MAYFDSQKNRVLWEKELAELRKERDARKSGKSMEAAQEKAAEAMSETREFTQERPNRIRTSYNELLREELMSINAMKQGKVTQKMLNREIDEPSVVM